MTDLKVIVKQVMTDKRGISLSILFGFLSGIAAVGLFATSGYLISKAALLPPLYVLTFSIAFLKLFSIIRAVSRYAERYFSHRATFTILSQLRALFFQRLEPFVPSIFEKYRSGDLLSRIVGDVESLQHFFLRVYYPPIVMLLVFLSTVLFTLFFSIEVAFLFIVGLVITGFLVPLWFARKQKRVENEVSEFRSLLSSEVTELMLGFLDLKLYQELGLREKELSDLSNQYITKQNQSKKQMVYSHVINHWVALLVSWSILSLGAFLVARDHLDGVFLAMLVMISLTVFETSTPMAAFPLHFEDSRRASHRLLSVVDKHRRKAIDEPGYGSENVEPLSSGAILLKNVSYRFPDEERLALHDVTISLPSGSKTAIVGPSGSGKSTLLNLLLKIYHQYDGEIIIGGKNLTNVKEKEVWKNMNPVLQTNHFFYGTIRDNLLSDRTVTDEDMLHALSVVKLDHFSLEDFVLEKGTNLSGGEKQRLAIARVLVKAETLSDRSGIPIWILDEPMSSIDALTERRIYKHLFQQYEGHTMILVSHRLTGLEEMDQIIVMDKGEVIESGTFQELMNMKGYTYRLKQIEQSIFL
ncbi:thiol reductant ABC exporter subunit CydC [Desertibacillus haloalkaliphilus]|uniref:thiol reductant ABC exporter subunit CydC n=1 Tax=Desertibacillus haloalkaliphilus TaxID=1328930 RepID=UPI001C25B8E2|nr:thiol reductant ABC exporter subunit CydC [Desertibacillus haloalkaliphilus]MBU8906200.1 thiol reductant ABC exporter subunit CydC [Desertibacillus haloalkaliphilus]